MQIALMRCAAGVAVLAGVCGRPHGVEVFDDRPRAEAQCTGKRISARKSGISAPRLTGDGRRLPAQVTVYSACMGSPDIVKC